MKVIKQKSIMLFQAYIFLFSAILIIFPGCKPDGLLPSYTASDISYGPDKENILDISLPEGRTVETPVIILIHGGAWTGGDKSDFAYLRKYFSRKGFAVFSINYRLARVEGTGLRNILEDMDFVIAYVKEQSGTFIYSKDAVFLAGHSAGGHIALLYPFSKATKRSIRGVVSFCGIADLTDPELEKFLIHMHENQNKNKKGFLPGNKQFDLIGFIAGPEREKRIAYSPQFLLRDIPVILFCGKMDDIIPWTQSENLHKKMKERGFDSTLHVYPDMGHDITPYYGEIMKITEQWIRDRM